ncbi:MAG: UDP-N-acetylglucosamine 2-epimerase (non-hydrolyzing) [Patescibacteria group bacterium]
MKTILFVFGTRPEAIKLAPLIIRMKKQKRFFNVKVCVTGQHREMLDQILSFFKIVPDFDLNLMKNNQFLFDLTASSLKNMDTILEEINPDILIVQGDTTSAFVGALAAFYRRIKIAYLEDGLRSFNKYSPFPEEINRKMISQLADFHFAPTKLAGQNLRRENIKQNVWVVGNSVIDALRHALKIIHLTKKNDRYQKFFNFLDYSKKIILVTGHRRESFGKPLENICRALKNLAENYPVQIVYPVHLNPRVKEPVYKILGNTENIHLIKPLEYPYLIWLMKKSYLIITDSGGIQEEAPSLNKPILVTREVTERTEGLKAGTAKLVGANYKKIVQETLSLLNNSKKYQQMAKIKNPYGDGRTCERIIKVLKKNS